MDSNAYKIRNEALAWVSKAIGAIKLPKDKNGTYTQDDATLFLHLQQTGGGSTGATNVTHSASTKDEKRGIGPRFTKKCLIRPNVPFLKRSYYHNLTMGSSLRYTEASQRQLGAVLAQDGKTLSFLLT
jgi:hypothetical protein